MHGRSTGMHVMETLGCTVQSIYDDLSGNCRTAQKVGRCLNAYTIECDGTNSPSNYCSGGA
jgi:hypothetical protein